MSRSIHSYLIIFTVIYIVCSHRFIIINVFTLGGVILYFSLSGVIMREVNMRGGGIMRVSRVIIPGWLIMLCIMRGGNRSVSEGQAGPVRLDFWTEPAGVDRASS